jgi:hypothetical protein
MSKDSICLTVDLRGCVQGKKAIRKSSVIVYGPRKFHMTDQREFSLFLA